MAKQGPMGPGNAYGKKLKFNAFRMLCQAYPEETFSTLWSMFKDTEVHPAIRFQIGKYISEQGFGKAPQSLEIQVAQDDAPWMMTTEQLRLAAAEQTQELVCNIIASGKLDEYTRMVDAEGGKEVMLLENLSSVTDGEQDKPAEKAKPRKGKKAQG